jgi:mono/diheme cytochrome c family protein
MPPDASETPMIDSPAAGALRRAAPLIAAALGTALIALAAFTASAQAVNAEKRARGAYLAAIMDCGGCHTGGALIGKPDPALHLAGSGIGFQIPDLGIFYPPNLTSDRETGLGAWSEAEIVTAVRTGVRPDGRILAPVMPWHAYGHLTDEDAGALAHYLATLPPVRHAAPPPAGPSETPPAPYLTVVVPGR